jgi:hypothetical protein
MQWIALAERKLAILMDMNHYAVLQTILDAPRILVLAIPVLMDATIFLEQKQQAVVALCLLDNADPLKI